MVENPLGILRCKNFPLNFSAIRSCMLSAVRNIPQEAILCNVPQLIWRVFFKLMPLLHMELGIFKKRKKSRRQHRWRQLITQRS